MHTHGWKCLALMTLGLLATPTFVSGQRSPTQVRPVFLAIPDAFPDVGVATDALVLRAPDKDVILLRAGSGSPVRDLGAATSLLARMRSEELQPSQPVILPIVGYVLPDDAPTTLLPRMEAALARLSARPVMDVGNLGPGRWIPFHGS